MPSRTLQRFFEKSEAAKYAVQTKYAHLRGGRG